MKATIEQFETFVKIRETGADMRNVGQVVKVASTEHKVKMTRAECLDILYNFWSWRNATFKCV